MASWKDGAAYAPIERPDGFATPVADALPAAEPYTAATPGPMERPGGFQPNAQPPLESLGRTATARRDPRDEFAVASLSLTSGPGGTAHRDPRASFALSTSAHVDTTQLPPPTGAPLAPAPPSQAWPQPQPRQRQQPQAADGSRTLCVIGAVVSFFGLILPFASSFLLLVSAALGTRTSARTSFLPYVAGIAGGLSLLALFITGEPGAMGALASLTSLAVMIWFIVGASRSL